MSYFITFEGGDGAGKSTLLSLVEEAFKKQGRTYVRTREPGGTPLAEEIRTVLLKPRSEMTALSELFLYEAARADHVAQLIKPSLAKGLTVLCDRFAHSSIAYQGVGRGLGIPTVRTLNKLACAGCEPHLVVWLRVPPEVAKARRENRKGEDPTRIDLEAESFHRKVFQAFELMVQEEPELFVVLDGEKPPQDVAAQLFQHPHWKKLFTS